MDNFDYIIVGAGSAGCVLANRLSEDGKASVLVLEAGGSDRSIMISMPSALAYPMHSPRFNWGFSTEPEPSLRGRKLNLPRGKVIGGSSSINGMCYVRGNPLDYETWDEMGAKGWSFENVLPYFKRAESYDQGADAYRGGAGPLGTKRGPMTNVLYRAFVEAGRQAGYGKTDDMNGARQEGFGAMDMTVAGGKRCSAAVAYLRPALLRKNVELRTHALVEKILIERSRATGIRYRRDGETRDVTANREVIVSAGSIKSPQILKLSGIGPAEELASFGIEIIKNLPGVGGNLMDHLELFLQVACPQPITLYSAMSLMGKAKIGIEWLLTHEGLGATNHYESGGFIRSSAGIKYPDIQYHFLPIAISSDGQTMENCHGYQVHTGTKRSKSRGWVKLRSGQPQDAPRVQFNYMSHEDDWSEFRAVIRHTREIYGQPAMDAYRGAELAPGAKVTADSDLDDFIRDHVESAYHPCGTCRMGLDEKAVVDPSCRVFGIANLRVIDSSIMPIATAGDLNAPTLMLAEKGADIIRGTGLPKDTAPFYIAPKWQERQREGEPLRKVPT